MIQLPTGGGKTSIAAALLAGWGRGRKAAWLTHRRELSEQTCLVLNNSGVTATNTPSWEIDDPAPAMKGGVVILMVQTVSRRNRSENVWDDESVWDKGVWDSYGPNDLLVIDEAHHATAPGYERAINQWPGRVVGLTATPWRLERDIGFNHLFRELYCGPQVSQLQAERYLCEARVLIPQPEDIIRGGGIRAGEYTPKGIEQANSNRPDVMTVGALRFWQHCASERPTIIYAVSTGHANNLTTVFNDAGISAAVMLSDTPQQERYRAINSFRDGNIQVLINVAVAAEGFDLPDASCVVLTRPTMSLALYLQMVGRGLRPKSDGGDCLILDLAGNSDRHGLPEDDQDWSLEPHGISSSGDAPGVWCEKCWGVSPAASHLCKHCGVALGKDCGICGKWRANKRWMLADKCDHQHDVVCDLCHLDAHIKANLPENRKLRESAIDPLLFTLVDEIRRRLLTDTDTRRKELSELITQRTQENSNRVDLGHLFDAYISSLPEEERPSSSLENGDVVNSWRKQRQEELDQWNEELATLKSKTAMEDKVRRGCNKQLGQAKSQNFSEDVLNILDGLQGSSRVAKKIAIDKYMHKYFLYEKLRKEGLERTLSQSEQDEYRDMLNRGATLPTEQGHRFLQLSKQLDRDHDHRLQTMKRQLKKYWREIWVDCQQSPERE